MECSLVSAIQKGNKGERIGLSGQQKETKHTLKIPAIDRVRLEVLETSKNSEKPNPKANRPPMLRAQRE